MASIQHFCISNLLQLITQSAHHDNRLVNRWSVSNTEALICKYNEAAWTSQPFMHYIPHKKGGVTSWILWNEHLVSISEIKGPVWHHSRHYVCLFTTKEKKKNTLKRMQLEQTMITCLVPDLLAWEAVFQRSFTDLFWKEGLLETDFRNHFTIHTKIKSSQCCKTLISWIWKCKRQPSRHKTEDLLIFTDLGVIV